MYMTQDSTHASALITVVRYTSYCMYLKHCKALLVVSRWSSRRDKADARGVTRVASNVQLHVRRKLKMSGPNISHSTGGKG